MQNAHNPLADPDMWILVYVQSRDEHIWAYIGLEPQPWKMVEDETMQAVLEKKARESSI